ncbi:placenta-specific protein 9 isoform X3 [Sarcophilus harrisii]|uniref:placenta-specific protein 9 isoform X3 n=1 Tax=Sarcophilus harrisii TaxID=9305 RepID=UPI001301C52D|nr:placenta-specific protein 9 isoform X3 [Sarcophilus harrisii]
MCSCMREFAPGTREGGGTEQHQNVGWPVKRFLPGLWLNLCIKAQGEGGGDSPSTEGGLPAPLTGVRFCIRDWEPDREGWEIMLFIWALHLALVLQGGFSAAVQPLRSSPGNEDKRMKWCDEHKAFHNRLDIVEETLDKTVEHLESEVKNLLNLMNSIAWNLPPASGSPTENFLGDESL